MPDDIRSEFSIDEQGKVFASRRAIARLSGIAISTMQDLLKRIENQQKCPEMFKGFAGQIFESNRQIPYDLALKILTYYYLRGKFTHTGCGLIGLPFISSNDKPVIEQMKVNQRLKTRLENSKSPEKQVQNKLAKHLKGATEVPTVAGRIDILTSSEIIEVKEVRQWKSALGQVLVYGEYYPCHKKRIHLFGKCHDSFVSIVKKHCEKFDVIVTLESELYN